MLRHWPVDHSTTSVTFTLTFSLKITLFAQIKEYDTSALTSRFQLPVP